MDVPTFDQVRASVDGCGAPVRLLVYGQAAPKGSSKAIPFRGKDGKLHATVMASNYDKLKGWESSVRSQAQIVAHSRNGDLMEGALAVRLLFGFTRPPSVKASKRPFPTAPPDLDKLIRACLDPLKGTLIKDDSLVVSAELHKRYVSGAPFAIIEVREVPRASATDTAIEGGLFDGLPAPGLQSPAAPAPRTKPAGMGLTSEDL